MDASSPWIRRRGFVVIHTDPSPEDELDSAEGVMTRVHVSRSGRRQPLVVTSSRTAATPPLRGSSRSSVVAGAEPLIPRARNGGFKSGTVTGIRRRSPLHR